MMSARFFKGKLPDFIIAGIYKSGTTSLFVNLSKHSRIEMSPNAFRYGISGMMSMKESHFFDQEWSKGIEWYRSLFNNNDKLQGEAASKYLFREEYIKRMSLIVPHAKIIISLRNPVTRAYAHFNDFKQRFRDFLPIICARPGYNKNARIRMIKFYHSSFDEAIKKEIDNGITVGGDIIGKGLYIDFIENLLKYYPRKQVLTVISEQMKQDMQATYNKIFDFLAVKRAKINFDMDVHVRKYEKPMDTWAKETLNKIYSSYNERLFNFLGYKVPEWDTNNERASFYSQ